MKIYTAAERHQLPVVEHCSLYLSLFVMFYMIYVIDSGLVLRLTLVQYVFGIGTAPSVNSCECVVSDKQFQLISDVAVK